MHKAYKAKLLLFLPLIFRTVLAWQNIEQFDLPSKNLYKAKAYNSFITIWNSICFFILIDTSK